MTQIQEIKKQTFEDVKSSSSKGSVGGVKHINFIEPKRTRRDRKKHNETQQQRTQKLQMSKNIKHYNYQISKTLIQYYAKIQILNQSQYIKQQKVKSSHFEIKNEERIILNILGYYLGEHQQTNFTRQEDKTFQQWQQALIRKQIKLLQLGTYVIKLPNPDNPPEEFIQMYEQRLTQQQQKLLKKVKKTKKTGQKSKKPIKKIKQLSLDEALLVFSEMFEIEDQETIIGQQYQQIAFTLAYYMLDFPQYTYKQAEQSADKAQMAKNQQKALQYNNQAHIILKQTRSKIYQIQYLRQIQQKNLQAFYKEKMNQGSKIQKLQRYLQLDQKDEIDRIVSNFEGLINVGQAKVDFQNFKLDLLRHIKTHFQNYYKYEAEIAEDNIQKTILEQFRFTAKFCTNLADYLHIFHLLISIIYTTAFVECNPEQSKRSQIIIDVFNSTKNDADVSKRKLCNGGTLKKKKVGKQSYVWARQFRRPKDILTLLRNVLLYRLTIRGNMFVRQFLSRDGQYFYLIVSCHEKIYEQYAQKHKVSMEVQLGSIDLFSFEPVDRYYRPLRLNKYITEKQFMDKYNLHQFPESTTVKQGSQSYQTFVITLYHKAQEMNRDELRSKIIGDHNRLYKIYSQIAKLLNQRYVEEQNILQNQYNTQVVTREQWQVYHIYVNLLIQYCDFIKKYSKFPDLKEQYQNNLGLLYRLAFVKAAEFSNNTYFNHSKSRGFFQSLSEDYTDYKPLNTIWDRIGIKEPSCFTVYQPKKKFQRLWRKYETNQIKRRSKYVFADRVSMLKNMISKLVNVESCQEQQLITEFFPSHDPYILKGIKIKPYFKVFQQNPNQQYFKKQSKLVDLFKQFMSEANKNDFTTESLEEKLQLHWSHPTTYDDISIHAIKNYAGEKIALFFSFTKYILDQTKYIFIIALVVQCLLWAQNTNIIQSGTSTLTTFNNTLVVIFSILNILWMTSTIQKWRNQQKTFEFNYGLSQYIETEEKRACFQGSFKRNLQTNQMNFQYYPSVKKYLRVLVSTIVNVAFVALVASTVIAIYVFKMYLIQKGTSDTISNTLPAFLISLSTQIYNFIYKSISRILTVYQNHKTFSQFESSLVFKIYLINFFNTFISLFLIAFCSSLFPAISLCNTPINIGILTIDNCQYQLSNQMLTTALVSLVVELLEATLPFIKFQINKFRENVKLRFETTKIYKNYYEPIDAFFEEQFNMETFMYNEEIDNTSLEYMNFMIRITTLSLFGPALPFAFCILYFHGMLAIHSNKYKILYLSRRITPRKSKSIGIWLDILELVSYMGMFTNVGFAIFTRQLNPSNSPQLFFGLVLGSLLFKYYISLIHREPHGSIQILDKRNKKNLKKAFLGLRQQKKQYVKQPLVMEIKGLNYEQLNRKPEQFIPAKLKVK